jgi:hypothetical protein
MDATMGGEVRRAEPANALFTSSQVSGDLQSQGQLPPSVLYSVLAVSEIWLRKATKNSEISIPHYNFFH